MEGNAGVYFMASPFSMLFRGEDVSPETMSLKQLAQFITELEDAIAVEGGIKSTIRSPIISLIKLVQTNNTLAEFETTEHAAQTLENISSALSLDEPILLKPATRLHLKKMVSAAREYKMEVEFRGRDRDSVVLDWKSNFFRPEKPLYPMGNTTIYGVCDWIGGNPPKATIRLISPRKQNELSVYLTMPMVESIKEYLYKEVCIEGTAQWNSITWKIEKFTASRVSPGPSRKYAETFRAFADVVGDILEGQSPEVLLKKWRDENDPYEALP